MSARPAGPWRSTERPTLLPLGLSAMLFCACAHPAKAPSATAAKGMPYTSHALELVLQPRLTDDAPAQINVGHLDSVLADLFKVLAAHPPAFASPEDYRRAVVDVYNFGGALDAALEVPQPSVELLWRAGLLHSFGSLLNLPGEADAAIERFTKALELEPDHPAANYHYGVFLGGEGRTKECIPYLLKAKALGFDEADHALALAYILLDDRPSAIARCRSHLERNPSDQRMIKLLGLLEAGKPIDLRQAP